MAETAIKNTLKNSIIEGNFIGRDQNNYLILESKSNNIFKDKIFLHYNGEKISKLLLPQINRNALVCDTNKIAVALFDNLYVSLSDIIQSSFLYNHLFRQILSFDDSFINIIGTKVEKTIDDYFEERETYYFNTGFYHRFYKDTKEIKDLLLNYNGMIPKYFETKLTLSFSWKENLYSYHGELRSIKSNYLRNAIMCISDFSNKNIDKIISIPDHLNGMPFILDSINQLSLLPDEYFFKSKKYFELFLAAEWVKCYIENSSCKIFNSIIGCMDSSLGLNTCFDFKSLHEYLKRFKLKDYFLSLEIEELINFRLSCEKNILQNILTTLLTSCFKYNDQHKLYEKTNMIYSSKCSNLEKLKDQITLLFEEVKDLNEYGK